VESHNAWKDDIAKATGKSVSYPMIGDPDLQVAKLYDMLGAEAGNTFEGRTAVDNQTVRTVFLIGPDKKIKMQMSYPMTTGRNFEELLRVLDSVQLTFDHKVATPAGWSPGDDVIVVPSVSDDDARDQHGDFDAKLPYLRVWLETICLKSKSCESPCHHFDVGNEEPAFGRQDRFLPILC
jgi:alkyl hydroperoxide reductase subunit AhpC